MSSISKTTPRTIMNTISNMLMYHIFNKKEDLKRPTKEPSMYMYVNQTFKILPRTLPPRYGSDDEPPVEWNGLKKMSSVHWVSCMCQQR